MSLKLGHGFAVLSVYERDHWRRRFCVGKGLDNGETLYVRSQVNDSQINMVQGKAEDIERVLRTTGLYLTACAVVGKLIAVVTDQDDIPFHTLS